MSLSFEKSNALAVLDAVIADMRASGDTGHVENLLQARADFAELIEAAQAAITNPKGLNRLGVAIARARGIV